MTKKIFIIMLFILSTITLAQAFPALPWKTGQTTNYYYGDDGVAKAGVAWPSPRFTDNNNGTVTDNLTGLIWLKNANCFSLVTWQYALIAANSLVNGQCGLTDGSVAGNWHLPTRKELLSLVDFSKYSPSLPVNNPFLNVQLDFDYLSSTTSGRFTDRTWSVNMALGTMSGYTKSYSLFYVWPVREGQADNFIHLVVSKSGTGNGTIASNDGKINCGDTCFASYTPPIATTLNAWAALGSTFSGWSGAGCSGTGSCTLYSSASTNAAAMFTLSTYTVTLSADANGTISPSMPQTVPYGTTVQFTVTPNVDYVTSVGGTCGGTLSGTTYTTAPITGNCTVSITFTPLRYTVTLLAGANGTISPSTPQTVNNGSTMQFTITPNTGYTVSLGGTCGGSLVGTTFTTLPVTGNCTVSATFTLITYKVTPSAGVNGTISPSTPQTIAYGATTQFTVTPNTGYAALVVGCSGFLAGNIYTTAPITANCTVSATFTQNTYKVTPKVIPPGNPNGTISPSTPQTIASGAMTQFTVTPNTGYKTASVDGCGGTLAGNVYTTAPVTANCTVSATFTPGTYTVTPSAGANGTISPSTPQIIASGTTTQFVVTPDAGYIVAIGGNCGGALVGNTYTTAPVTADCKVQFHFHQ